MSFRTLQVGFILAIARWVAAGSFFVAIIFADAREFGPFTAALNEISLHRQVLGTGRFAQPDSATYPETSRLSPGDAQSFDLFGWSVAADGDTIVVGSPGESGGHGDPLPGAGAAYIFERELENGGSWVETARLAASDAQPHDAFAASIAIRGNTIVLGAPNEDGGDGDPLPGAGAAYVFERNLDGPGNWVQVAKLVAGDPQPFDAFGNSVSIHGDTIAVGAYLEDGGLGNPLTDTGAVYVFERNQGGTGKWGQSARLADGQLMDNVQFGTSVSLDGNTVAVGAPFHNIFPGPPLGWAEAGLVLIFERNQGGTGNWGEAAGVIAGDFQEEDHFGMSVFLQGDTLVAGAPAEDGGSGDPLPGAGAAYIFERDQGGPGNWGQTQRITAGDPQAGDAFAAALGISGDIIVMGALYEDGGPGDPTLNAGAAYVFERHTGGWGQWGQAAKLMAGDGQSLDRFGGSASISYDTLVIGASFEDGGKGDPLPSAGAAYVFEKSVVFTELIYFPLVLR
jgi:hypothetical protein